MIHIHTHRLSVLACEFVEFSVRHNHAGGDSDIGVDPNMNLLLRVRVCTFWTDVCTDCAGGTDFGGLRPLRSIYVDDETFISDFDIALGENAQHLLRQLRRQRRAPARTCLPFGLKLKTAGPGSRRKGGTTATATSATATTTKTQTNTKTTTTTPTATKPAGRGPQTSHTQRARGHMVLFFFSIVV